MRHHRRIRTLLDVIATTAMTVAAIALIWAVVTRPSLPAQGGAAPPARIENVEAKALSVRATEAFSPGPGQSRPRLALVEYADFECPYCVRHAQETLPQLKRDFVDTGQVALVFKHFPLEIHAGAMPAAEVAACAGDQARFWPMHDRLFTVRQLQMPALLAAAGDVGLDKARLKTCLASVRPRIEQDVEEGKRLGVQSTPTFLIGELRDQGVIAIRRKINGAYGYDVFKQTFQELLATPVAAR